MQQLRARWITDHAGPLMRWDVTQRSDDEVDRHSRYVPKETGQAAVASRGSRGVIVAVLGALLFAVAVLAAPVALAGARRDSL